MNLSTNGEIIIVNSDESIELNLQGIISVGIQNLADVTEHQITSILNSRSHMVRFVNGGVLEFAYNDAGELIELNSRDLTVVVKSGSEVLFSVPEKDYRTS